jgi:GAF domain-containing protein/anti-sigma regulatory factor (Ser/Thr protein kinase)
MDAPVNHSSSIGGRPAATLDWLATVVSRFKGRLFRKYAALLVALVGSALVANAAIESYYSYLENRDALIAVQREKAQGAAAVIEQFVREVEGQLGWTSHASFLAGQGGMEQRRFDFLRLLRQAPAITEVVYVDGDGREQLRISRLSMDLSAGSGGDRSGETLVREAREKRRYVSPIYFRKESEPYLTLAIATGGRRSGVTIAEVNLKFIWDVVSRIRIGRAGAAYAVDKSGLLIAHPDIGLVLRKTDLSRLEQVRAAIAAPAPGTARGSGPSMARDRHGREVLTAYATVESLSWHVFVEQPRAEAFVPIYDSLKRTGLVLLSGLVLAALAGMWLAQRLAVPIRTLATGAERLGAGDLDHRIELETGDEVETLASSFNAMGARLQESYEGLERKVEERTAELAEALAHQTASAEVLRVISGSPGNLDPVFDQMLASARALCGVEHGHLLLYDGIRWRAAALHNLPPAYAEFWRKGPIDAGPSTALGHIVATKRPLHVEDMREREAYAERHPLAVATVELGEARSFLIVPLIKDGTVIGALPVYRREVRPFEGRQISLLESFAQQAVIAIENARLFEAEQARTWELKESLEYQTAISEVLGVISKSPNNVQPVFDAIVGIAGRLCRADHATIFKVEDNTCRLIATADADSETVRHLRANPFPVDGETTSGRAILERRVVHLPDILAQGEFQRSRELAKITRARALLSVPFLRDGEPVGSFTMARTVAEPFTERQIALVSTFADQAVIAIENARLFEAEQARTKELQVALEHQTATSELLKVIGRSTLDLQPVYDTLAEYAVGLCESERAFILRYDGQALRVVATHNVLPEMRAYIEQNPIAPGRDSGAGRAVLERRTVHIHDVKADAEYTYYGSLTVPLRTVLAIPMLRGNDVLGVIAINRHEVRPFTPKQIALMETFADQAVIAIENVRLFEEVQARTKELQESLEYQTAISEVLGVISRSPTDVQPVFEAIVASAARLCDATFSAVARLDGELLHLAAVNNMSPEETAAYRSLFPRKPLRSFILGRAFIDGRPIHVPDIEVDPDYDPHTLAVLKAAAPYRTYLGIPILRHGVAIGAIGCGRREVRPFTPAQVALVETFADQAVIAIENARLLDELQMRQRELEARTKELQESLEYQTATSEVLSVISRSPSELKPVLDAIVGTAGRLCEAERASIRLLRPDGAFHLEAGVGQEPQMTAFLAANPVRPGRDSVSGRVALDKRTIHIEDALGDKDFTHYPAADIPVRRTLLGVPLMKNDEVIGVLVMTRTVVKPFTERQIALVETFADQAVIAINNVRLFEEVQARTKELTESLEYQTATSEVLGVISKSPNELQPVLDTLVATAGRLCEAPLVSIHVRTHDQLPGRARLGFTPEMVDALMRLKQVYGRGSLTGRVMEEGRAVHIPDVQQDAEYTFHELTAITGARSMLGVPLVAGGESRGILLLYRREPIPFTERQISLIETFADQAVIAIENARLFEAEQARTRELQDSLKQQTATAEVLKVISRSTFDLQKVLDTLVESAAHLCEADHAWLFRREGEAYRWAASFGHAEDEHVRLRQYMLEHPVSPGRGTLIGRTALEGRPVHIPDVLADAEYAWHEGQRVGNYRSVFAVPLLREGMTIGVLALSRVVVRQFNQGQIELATTFADQAVIAIENARLFDEVQARTAELARSVQELESLSQVSQTVSSSLDLKTVLPAILEHACDISDTGGGAIYAFAKERNQFELAAGYKMSEELIAVVRAQPIQLGETLIGQCALQQKALQLADIQAEGESPIYRALLQAGVRALLAVPLLHQGEPIGALVVRRKLPGAFPPEAIRLLQSFASQSAIAIHNARLFNEVQEKSRQLEVASLHKSQFLANMSHELRTPLNAILGYTELIQDGVYGEPAPKVKGVLDRVQTNGRHLLGLINDVLDLSKIEAGQLVLRLEDYSLADVVQTVVTATESLAASKKLALKVEVPSSLPAGRGDQSRLAQVLLNLVGNAIKFTDEGEIRISARTRNAKFVIKVADTGPGIPEAEHSRIFEEFHQVDSSNTKKKGGTGLGLAITKRIVELHGGRISVESEVGKGATFRVDLPIRVEKQRMAA